MTTHPVLATRSLQAGYNGRSVLNDVNMELRVGEVLCLIGHNGAGKSTLIKTLFGVVAPLSGEVLLDGKVADGLDPRQLSAAGIALVPEGRGIFPSLSVREVLSLGLWAAEVPEAERPERIEWVLNVLPMICEFFDKRAGSLSGGQQQMVSIARALLTRPRCLLMDEPSIGLSPKLFQDLLKPIRELQQRTGISILLVEQNVREALKISDRVIAMKSGSLIHEALPHELADNAKLMALY